MLAVYYSTTDSLNTVVSVVSPPLTPYLTDLHYNMQEGVALIAIFSVYNLTSFLEYYSSMGLEQSPEIHAHLIF